MAPESTPTNKYDLKPEESAILQAFNMQALGAKAKLRDIDEARREAEAALNTAQQMFNGALTVIAGAHGLAGGSISPDLKTITRGV